MGANDPMLAGNKSGDSSNSRTPGQRPISIDHPAVGPCIQPCQRDIPRETSPAGQLRKYRRVPDVPALGKIGPIDQPV
ncbi:uncharacterized protein METZ01_LOCUS54375 [marine metagenome]|uniref:Uncharacterized protein n=1 Tax=marine metagenome TaxID=408172 RepID=A0A381SDX6_9ZZZZ